MFVPDLSSYPSSPVVTVSDVERIAVGKLPKNALDYYRSGADAMYTLRENRDAFKRYRICPRVLVDVSKRDLSTTLLKGRTKVSMPIGISPTAMQRMAHPSGECASVRAAKATDTVFTLSTISTSSIEEVAEAAPAAAKWFQLYIYSDRAVTEALVKRAERAGFQALVLTVDAPFFGRRIPDVKNAFALPPHLSMANFTGMGELETKAGAQESGNSGINNYVASLFDQSLSWRDVEWLKSVTCLPIILKGVMRADDARLAAEAGVSAIVVSNHGARQVDGVDATIDVLADIKRAVKDQDIEVYFDGGVREGTDVLKALALGADMVFVGRPVLWGLAWDGQKGVEKVLEILRDELDRAMALSGICSIDKIRENAVVLPKATL